MQRRDLRFTDLAEVMPDVHRLAQGHRTIGSWSLGQICQHLADSFVGSMEGFDLRHHRIKRFFLKKQMLKVALTKGIPRGWTVDPGLTPTPNAEVNAGIEVLSQAIDRYRAHRGELHAHPLFGIMPRDTWDRVHCVHCAHHLSLAVPVIIAGDPKP